MITETNVRGVQNGKKLVSLALKSTESKPTTGIMNGSTCIEVNTGKTYVYDEEGSEWTEISSSGGGGGGGGSSDFSTAEVTLINSGSGTYFMAYNITLFDQEANTLSITSRQVGNQYRFKTPIPTGGTSYFIVEFDDYDFDTPPVITGDIVLGSDGFEVSGDGTITIKGTGMLG